MYYVLDMIGYWFLLRLLCVLSSHLVCRQSILKISPSGHWILNVFPQCRGDLHLLGEVDFPLYDPPLESMPSDLACDGCDPFPSSMDEED